MTELQTQFARYIVPLTVTLTTLPILQQGEAALLPSSNHAVPAIEVRDFQWQNFDPMLSQLSQSDISGYTTIVDFALNLVRESSELPPEFSRVLVEDFWNLV